MIFILSTILTACGGSGGSGKRNPLPLINPDLPSAITASSAKEEELNVSWVGNQNDGRYKIIIANTYPYDGSACKIIDNASSPSNIAIAGGEYYVWIISVNPDGSEESPISANNGAKISISTKPVTPQITEPDTPGNLNLISNANGQLEVSWSGNANDGSYSVVVDDDKIIDNDTVLLTRYNTTSPTVVNGLATGTYHAWIIVKASDGSETTFSVNIDGVAVSNPGSLLPENPSNAVAVTPKLGEIKVTWNGNARDGSYKVVIDDDYSYDNDTPTMTKTLASSPLIITGLQSANYYAWVIPVNPDNSEGTPVQVNNGTALAVYNGTLNTADDSWTLYAGTTTTIPIANLLANDANNMTSDPLEIVSVKDATNGTVSLDGSMITFTSTGSAGVNATFKYVAQIKDNNLFQVEGTVTLTVNAKPSVVANADTTSVQQGGEIYLAIDFLLTNDEGTEIALTNVFNSVGGNVSISGNNITFKSTGLAYEPAQFNYKIVDSLGTEANGTVFVTVDPLPPVDAYIYENADIFNQKKTDYVPPTIINIFNSWGRFSGNEFYPDLASASGKAAAWNFLTQPDRVSMPLNVDPYNGFVSLEKVDNYTFETTLSSTSSDDDTIGLVIAFVRVDTNGDGIEDTNYTLNALRTQGHTDPKTGWGITYGTGLSAAKYHNVEWVIAEKEVGPTIRSWAAAGNTRVKIVRTGDIIKCYTTLWGNTGTYEATSEIVIDLNSDPRLAKFKNKTSYGYSTFSQPNSTYLDINFDGGIDPNTMMYVDWSTGAVQIWEYNIDHWEVTNKTIQEVIGYVRVVHNPETGKRYLIKKNSIELIE
jgi:hypothetical protein